MRRFPTYAVLVFALLTADSIAANQRFYVEKVSVEGIGGYVLPCESYTASLDLYSGIQRTRFKYESSCDGAEHSAEGFVDGKSLPDGGSCWIFTPQRFGTRGCGHYDNESGTLIFEYSTSGGGLTIRWRECRGQFAGQRPCR